MYMLGRETHLVNPVCIRRVFPEILFVIDSAETRKKKQFTSKTSRTVSENRNSGVIRSILYFTRNVFPATSKQKYYYHIIILLTVIGGSLQIERL